MESCILSSIENLKMENVEDFIRNFNQIQEKSLLETALLMEGLYINERISYN